MLEAYNFRRPTAAERTRPGTHPRLKPGDTVSWRNPSTGAHWGGLVVEFIFPQLGIATVRGDFGRISLRTGGAHFETRRVRLEHLTLEPTRPEAA